MRTLKLFISGKVSNLPYLVAYNNFKSVQRELETELSVYVPFRIYNPMDKCRANWSWLHCMIVCLWAIVRCDIVVQLDNWQQSKGARIEYKFAKMIGKNVIPYSNFYEYEIF